MNNSGAIHRTVPLPLSTDVVIAKASVSSQIETRPKSASRTARSASIRMFAFGEDEDEEGKEGVMTYSFHVSVN